MTDNSQSGSMMVAVMILAAISGAVISGMTRVINREMKATRQQEVKDTIASAQRILQKRFSCEASLELPEGTLLTACPASLPVLDNRKVPLLDPAGKLGDLDIYIRAKCDIDKGIRFEYARAQVKNGKLELLPDPLTGKKRDFANLYEQSYFCARFFPGQGSSAEFASKGLPQVSCAEGRAWSGMNNGTPVCSSPNRKFKDGACLHTRRSCDDDLLVQLRVGKHLRKFPNGVHSRSSRDL